MIVFGPNPDNILPFNIKNTLTISYVKAYIEQDSFLDNKNLLLGIVKAIAGLERN